MFKPSSGLLEKITGDGELIAIYSAFPKNVSQVVQERTLRLAMRGYVEQISEFYLKPFGDIHTDIITSVALECLRNCYDHSIDTPGEPIEFGLFLGDRGVCYGLYDHGAYFKSEAVKDTYENKRAITKFNRIGKASKNFGVGTHLFIYDYSDDIEVDAENGILYAMQLKERIIKQ